MINVAEKQKHVGELAKDPNHRFHRLYRVLCEEAWLTEAWKRIRQNKGSKTAGVDGQTKDDVDETLIKRLAEKLRKEEYQPTPVRRVYILKSDGKRKRPLGIPTIQDRIVQSALKMLLEPIYEQDFCNCSHGFRPKRSCMTALRDVAYRFPHSTWIIEGDITGCYDNINHGRLLSILRRRLRDEKLLRLINEFLKAGYLEWWIFHRTFSGTPQGGIVSPLLANIYLHELDRFMEKTLNANPRESKKEANARRTVEGRRIENRITKLRRWLKEGRKWSNWYKREQGEPLTAEMRKQIVTELKELEEKRKRIPYQRTRPSIGYVRYADDYLVILQQRSKAEAERVKEKIGIYLKSHLQLEQSEDKTQITHPANEVKFLGFNLKSRGGKRKGLQLGIPKETIEKLLKEVKRLCDLHHIDEMDLILKVNEKVRGWMNYYRYASAPQRTFSEVLQKIFWQVSHYLAAKHETSIAQVLKEHLVTPKGKTRKTLRQWVGKKAIDLWMFPPKTEQIYKIGIGQPDIDEKPQTIHEWATGRSIGKRIEALEEANNKCQDCGTTENLKVHHKGGLRGYRRPKDQREAGGAKIRKVLCNECHLKAHKGSYAPRNRSQKAT